MACNWTWICIRRAALLFDFILGGALVNNVDEEQFWSYKKFVNYLKISPPQEAPGLYMMERPRSARLKSLTLLRSLYIIAILLLVLKSTSAYKRPTEDLDDDDEPKTPPKKTFYDPPRPTQSQHPGIYVRQKGIISYFSGKNTPTSFLITSSFCFLLS